MIFVVDVSKLFLPPPTQFGIVIDKVREALHKEIQKRYYFCENFNIFVSRIFLKFIFLVFGDVKIMKKKKILNIHLI